MFGWNTTQFSLESKLLSFYVTIFEYVSTSYVKNLASQFLSMDPGPPHFLNPSDAPGPPEPPANWCSNFAGGFGGISEGSP